MRQVDTLGEDDRDSVWRCYDCALAWVDNQWCRLGRKEWIPLAEMPSGPFFEIEHPNFGDYRNTLLARWRG